MYVYFFSVMQQSNTVLRHVEKYFEPSNMFSEIEQVIDMKIIIMIIYY